MIQTVENTKNFSTTENGALGYKTTGSKLVDLNFRIPSMRNTLTRNDELDFIASMEENFEYTIKWLFFARDIRGGLGERDTFVSFFKLFYERYQRQAQECLSIISEFGRWKDIVDLAFCGVESLQNDCFVLIKNQLMEDAINLTNNHPISLLAKWMPSINASQKARIKAKNICKYLGMNFASYRKMLSKFRTYLDVTEIKTCGNRWGEIDYNKVSSNANLRYSQAFLKHDKERRESYLKELLSTDKSSSVKMNASVLYPHEIWDKYTNIDDLRYQQEPISNEDLGLEAMWKNLKDMDSTGNVITVVDGSGSMTWNTMYNVKPINIARSLGVYFAERCTGEFHNVMIEFSSTPRIIDINDCNTLKDKINKLSMYEDYSNTDIEKTFMLILDTAVKNHMKQEDMPERILIVSDMEFDHATTMRCNDFKTLFDTIQERFEYHGYKMPKLVFWNVSSRTNTIPMTENKNGVILVSGYSVNILNMVMSGKVDPWLALKETLDNERYNIVTEKLNSVA